MRVCLLKVDGITEFEIKWLNKQIIYNVHTLLPHLKTTKQQNTEEKDYFKFSKKRIGNV